MTPEGKKRAKRRKAAAEATEMLPGTVWPERPDLVQICRAEGRGHEFTGQYLSRDVELCREVMKDLIMGLSGRAIARKHKISRNSISAIEHIMAERGELAPLRQRVMQELDEIIHMGLEAWKEALAEDKIAPSQIPIPVLAAIDKRLQMQAGVVPGTGRTEREIGAADVEAAWAVLQGKVIDVTPPDAQSGVIGGNPKQIDMNAPRVSDLVSRSPAAAGTPEPLALHADQAVDSAPAAVPDPTAPDERGGGSPFRARGGAEPTGSNCSNENTK